MTTAAGSNGVGLGVGAGARRKGRSWSVADRRRVSEAGASVAGVAWRGRIASTPTCASNGSVVRGKVGRVGAAGGGAGGDKLVAGGERKPEVCSDPPCRAAAGRAEADAGREGRRARFAA